jgi:cytoskeletal protein RodZ
VKDLNKGLIAIIVIVIVVIVAAGAWFLMTPATSNNTTNNSTPINSTIRNQTQNQTNTTNTTNITAAKAKELAGQYIGMGVELEDPILTTYKGVTVWEVPVVTYTPEKSYQDPIYINAQNGNRVT